MAGAICFYSFSPKAVGLGLFLFVNVMKMNEDEMVCFEPLFIYRLLSVILSDKLLLIYCFDGYFSNTKVAEFVGIVCTLHLIVELFFDDFFLNLVF